jgi:hypothetical protein
MNELAIGIAHLVAMNFSSVPVPTDIRQVDVAGRNRLPGASLTQGATSTIRRIPPSINGLPRNRPGIPKPHPWKITGDHKLANAFGRHAKKRRRICERK